ncbi:MAG: helix-turn-helix transcriptional regulator [Clostridiales bacterium]|nr:helix-turn-helix transcriptional regulator [Candidatus Cacconaster stercorequi]
MVPIDVDYKKIGYRIRKLRTEKCLTQAELSAQIDCSNNYLSHVETAQTKPSLGMLLRIAVALNVSVDYFLLDTPFVQSETLIATEIAEKLQKCRPETLQAVKAMIDILYEQEQRLLHER